MSFRYGTVQKIAISLTELFCLDSVAARSDEYIGMAVSFFLLARATKTLPLGMAYAVWTGIGALGSVIVGIILFKEPVTAGRLIFAALLLIGIIGLKIASA